tara:strand:+ start:42 stop:746 length:705 start_codon:yes stop_codon:yes gene_type:complete
MAVNIDDVYQAVLAVANKEQRGYITPQEFQTFANHAQKEILEQYLYDINQFGRVPGNSTEHSDMLNLLDEKLSVFKKVSPALAVDPGTFRVQLPSDLYKIGSLSHVMFNKTHIFEEINYNELVTMQKSYLTSPTFSRPVYTNHTGGFLTIYPSGISSVNMSYIKQPRKPRWGYVVAGDKALYNASASVHFELHATEQTELVYKILKLSGVAIKQQDVAVAGQTLETQKIQQEKQ